MTGLCEGSRTNSLRSAWLRDGICVLLGVWDERAEVFSHLGLRVWVLDPRDRALQRYRLLHDICTTVGGNLCPEVEEYWTVSSNEWRDARRLGSVTLSGGAMFAV